MGLNKKKNNSNKKLTRKELRKQKRNEKKIKKQAYFSKKPLSSVSIKSNKYEDNNIPIRSDKNSITVRHRMEDRIVINKDTIENECIKEKKKQNKLLADMARQRKEQLLMANEKEDRLLKKLEKQLKLNKRKTKSIPKSFVADGLSYMLEAADLKNSKEIMSMEQGLDDINNDFEEDLALMASTKSTNNEVDSDIEDFEEMLNENDSSDEDVNSDGGMSDDLSIHEIDESSHVEEIKFGSNKDFDNHEMNSDDNENIIDEDQSDHSLNSNEKSDTWEDIYGRLRSKDGSVITNSAKYIPPAIRAKMESTSSEDKKRKEKLDRLKKQLKGLLNRLAESNMHGIATQIENLYMNNSRNDMNETLTSLIMESLISNVSTPERLLMEHILLVAILHANVGTEIGAHFLQNISEKFNILATEAQNMEDKSLDNTVSILAQMYNFKIFDAKLLYEILNKLLENFNEKHIDCILKVLRSVGFGLRKDDPVSLKNLILDVQKQAALINEGTNSSSRIKFLLDIVLAIKNNNVAKIPNYDPTYSEHLKKIMKGFMRKGNYVTQLNISLQDLLNVEQKGKWWIVGSAWTGHIENKGDKDAGEADKFSQKLLDLARKQRMNTDSRRDIFCIIISAEDYLDAFEKLLKLGLKNQQERDIIHVILHCCLQEKSYNPYYAILAQKFCEYDRKFQMTIKCSVWDKLKALGDHSGAQVSNLAKMLTYLFIEKGLPISTLKIVEFGELDKVTLRFMRQILLGILLHPDMEAIQGVFEKVVRSDKLKMFRESLRLFIHHFLLKNLKVNSVPENQRQLLEERAKMVERILVAKDGRLKL
ncbi:hypothetical protein GWI33_020901 [Rhynchophorus ferrugineus]|uniref:MI domain-containing protein n=1 Tax=Rhynchophorus ferrugineus TaxID=354439 RepID=A0A834M319_RHYFE|nr:hypothetical protein GWI33_020901 [Rhynchophorus ferrugineus]